MTVNRADDQLRRQTLDLLRFPLAVVVLTIHVWTLEGGPIIQGVSSSFENYPVLTALNHIINGFLRSQSVPIYFFISGYVFFYGVEFNREVWFRKIRNRIKTLLIPYLIWNFIALGIYILLHTLPALSQYSSDSAESLTLNIKGLLSCFYSYDNSLLSHPTLETLPPPFAEMKQLYPINVPLWFLRDLMLMVACAPVIYKLLNYFKQYAILVMGAVWFLLGFWTADTALELWMYKTLPSTVFFFSWGAYMSISRLDMLNEFGRWFKVSMFCYPLLALSYVAAAYLYPEACPIIKQINIFAGLLFAYNIAAWLLRTGRCQSSEFLSSASFFIYISHYLIGGRLLKLLYIIIHPSTDFMWILVYLLTTILVVCMLLFTFWLLRRYAPGVLKVVAGRK